MQALRDAEFTIGDHKAMRVPPASRREPNSLPSVFDRLLHNRYTRRWRDRPAMVLPDLARQAVLAASEPNPIQVAEILSRYTLGEHAERANAYFVREHEEASLFRRPLQNAPDAQLRLAGIAFMLQHLAFEPGARVLDFGCGTGWLSRCLAYMGADVVGVDVSENVLRLARQWLARDPLAGDLRVEFQQSDGIRLPVADASVDRIASFDAFHHVPDQAATLAEMARVLRPGGIAVFHEPGPEHSGTPEAQGEMRAYGVIENDIDLHRIWRAAQGCGFANIWISLPALHAPVVGIAQFDRVAAGRPSRDDLRRVMQNTVNFTYNFRVFALHKAGGPA